MPDGLTPAPQAPVDPEDVKLLTLARTSGSRVGGAGAAVRDDIGRTYTAGEVGLSALRLTALQAAVAAAVSSGARRLEAIAVHGAGLSPDDERLAEELGRPRVVTG
jgi:hypothetical protein